MWIIKKEETDEHFHLILEKNKYTVGRTSADLVLSHDNSISRSHAIFHLNEDSGVLLLEDIGSKYGTYLNENLQNNVKLNKGQRIKLSAGDRVRFGVFKNIWQIVHMPLVSMFSGLSHDQIRKMEQYMAMLGGKLIDRWESNCTHLTMSEIKLTVKALHALLEQRPIVTIDYWRDVLQTARRGRGTLPEISAYKPTHCDALLQHHNIDLGVQPDRKKIFANMTFVFMNRKQYDTYSPIVKKAGGVSRDLNSGVQKTFLLKNNVIVVQYMPTTQSQSSQTINSIESHLEANSLRMIPEYEIGLAIAHCSRDKYCNPSYKAVNDLMPSTSSTGFSISNTCFAESTETALCEQINNQRTELFVMETEHANIKEKTKTQQFSSLDNDSSMPRLRVTESVDENIQVHKRKRAAIPIFESDSEDDVPLFQFIKKPHLEENEKKQKETQQKHSPPNKLTPKPKAKPLPVIINSKKKTNISEGFLEKSQMQNQVKQPAIESSQAINKSTTKKRPRIAVISDNDSDDDDLFCFDDEPKKARVDNMNDENSDDELFGFSKTPVDRESDTENIENNNLLATEKSASSENKKNTHYVLLKPKVQSQKVSTVGWFSPQHSEFKIEKHDDTVKKEDSLDEKEQWIHTLKIGVERMKSLNISTRLKDNTLLPLEQSKSNTTAQNRVLNFKVFVKKQNLRPQQRIISTVSVKATCA